MTSCPQCSAPELQVTGATVWTAECKLCGYRQSGTANFGIPAAHRVQDVEVEFALEKLSQIAKLKLIVVELRDQPSNFLAEKARTTGMVLRLGPITKWRAEQYCDEASKAGIRGRMISQSKHTDG